MKDNNSKFPGKYYSRESLQVCSSMFPFFSYNFKIHNTHQREIKNLLLKTNNKQNSAIDNLVKEVTDCNQLLDRYNTIFFKVIQVLDC